MLARGKLDVTGGLRWSYDGVTMGLRRNSVVFPSLLPIPAARPPAVPSPVSGSIPRRTLIDAADLKTLHTFCCADTAPSRPGAGNSIRVPARHKLPGLTELFPQQATPSRGGPVLVPGPRPSPGRNLREHTRFARNFLAVAMSNALRLAKGARVRQVWSRL